MLPGVANEALTVRPTVAAVPSFTSDNVTVSVLSDSVVNPDRADVVNESAFAAANAAAKESAFVATESAAKSVAIVTLLASTTV